MKPMLKRIFPFIIGGAVVVFAACQDSSQNLTEPAVPLEGRGGNPLQRQINQAINSLWPGGDPDRSLAHEYKSDMFDAVGDGDEEAALAAAGQLASRALNALQGDPSLGGDVQVLLDLLTAFAGLPEVNVAELLLLLSELDPSAGVGVATESGGGIITTDPSLGVELGFGGVEFAPDDIPETLGAVVVIVERHAQPCHPLNQLPNQSDDCLSITTIPELTEDFPGLGVVVGVCTDLSASNLPLLRLFESQGPTSAQPVVLLPEEATPSFLVGAGTPALCQTALTSTESSWLENFARAGWDKVGKPVASLFAPEPLHAASALVARAGSLGGRTKNFSNIGWAEPVELDFGADGYRYLQLGFETAPPTQDGGETPFYDPDFDDSGAPWMPGIAPFWGPPTTNSCPTIRPAVDEGTTWDLDTQMLLRRSFFLPAGATNVTLTIRIDNDAQVYINGEELTDGVRRHEHCADLNPFVFTNIGDLMVPGVNLLAVRGLDRGVMSFIDAQVTFTGP